MQLACAEPLLELGSHDRFRQRIVVNGDDLHFGVTLGTPGQNCFCAPNDQQRFSLNGDPSCFRGHAFLQFAIFACFPGPNAGILPERWIRCL